MTDEDIDSWIKRLVGRDSRANLTRDPLVDSLRSAIETSDRSCSSEASDPIQLANLLNRLRSDGLLREPPRRRTALWWVVPAGAVVAAFFVARALLKTENPAVIETTAEERYRGISGSITLLDRDPEALAGQVMRELSSLGMRPQRLPGSDRIVISVLVDRNNMDVLRQWPRAKDVQIREAGRYVVFVDALPQ